MKRFFLLTTLLIISFSCTDLDIKPVQAQIIILNDEKELDQFITRVSLLDTAPLGIAVDYIGASNSAYVSNTRASKIVACRVSTTGNITLSGLQTIDGVSLSASNKALVQFQTDPTKNGPYTVASGAWTRVTTQDTPIELIFGVCTVSEGATLSGTSWAQTNNGITAVGTSNITWQQIGQPYVQTWDKANNKLTKTITGQTFPLRVAYPNDSIYVLNTSNGGTNMNYWKVGGSEFTIMANAHKAMVSAITGRGVTLDYIVFIRQHGEADAKSNSSTYSTFLSEMNSVNTYLRDSLGATFIINSRISSTMPLGPLPASSTYSHRPDIIYDLLNSSSDAVVSMGPSKYQADSIHFITTGNYPATAEFSQACIDILPF